jgi:hypothetical protein
VYGGTLVSNGDLFLNGNEDESHAANYIGNNHGGMLRIGEQYYIFYHRQTNRNSYSRQACAEPLVKEESGHFKQAEMTSCGLNGGPLYGSGRYEARIACNLWSKEGTGRYDVNAPKKVYRAHPYLTQDEKDGAFDAMQYIANMRDGAVAGFKYFWMEQPERIFLEIRGNGNGDFLVSTDAQGKQILAKVPVQAEQEIKSFGADLKRVEGKQALYFRYEGTGSVDFIAFCLQ